MPYYGHNTIQTTPIANRRAASWTKQRNKVRITTNPMVDSSSEQNLSTLGVVGVELEYNILFMFYENNWTHIPLNELV